MRSLWLPDMDWVGDRQPVNMAIIGNLGQGKTNLVAALLLAIRFMQAIDQ